MLVDGDDDSRMFVAQVLQRHGYVVKEARDGNQALALLIQDRRDEPALILLDLDLTPMASTELLTIKRSYIRLARIPVVVVGTSPSTALLGDGSAVAFLRRPVDESTLLSTVERHVRPA